MGKENKPSVTVIQHQEIGQSKVSKATERLPTSAVAGVFYGLFGLIIIANLLLLLLLAYLSQLSAGSPEGQAAWMLMSVIFTVPAFYFLGLGSLIIAVGRIIKAEKLHHKKSWLDYTVIVTFIVLGLIIPLSVNLYFVKVVHPRNEKEQLLHEQEFEREIKQDREKAEQEGLRNLYGNTEPVYVPQTTNDYRLIKTEYKPQTAEYSIIINTTKRTAIVTVTNDEASFPFCVRKNIEKDNRFSTNCSLVDSSITFAKIYEDKSLLINGQVAIRYVTKISDVAYELKLKNQNISVESPNYLTKEEAVGLIGAFKLVKF